MKYTTKVLGFSLPESVIARIDKDRGDIPRSRYVLRLLEMANKIQDQKKENRSD